MITFACDSNSDLYLDSRGNIATFIRDIDVAAQLCNNYLRTFLGDVFTDLSIGTDWFGIILSEDTGLQSKIDEITRVLLTVPFVTAVNQVQISQNSETREISLDVEVQTTAGVLTLEPVTAGV